METKDTGYTKIVNHFGIAIETVVELGTIFNPSLNAIKVDSLRALYLKAIDAINEVRNTFTAYKLAIDEREKLFSPLSKLITRFNNAIKTSGIDKEKIKTAQIFVRKLQGKRISPILSEEELKALAEQGKEVTQISAAQTGFDDRIDNLEQLNNFIANIPEFTPNEVDLQMASMNSYLENLKNANKNVISCELKLFNARANRDTILFDPDNGLVPVALTLKKYIVSILGTSNSTTKKINSLYFRNRQ